MRKLTMTLSALLLAACVALPASCAGKEKKPAKAKKTETRKMAAEQVFTFTNGAEPETLDPHKATGLIEANIGYALLEGLVTLDHKTLKPLPGVAEKWEVSKDGRVWTFHLRKNATWTNGDPVTARDFAYSFQRALKPETAAEYAYMLHYIKNAKAFNSGELKDFSKVGVATPDDYTVILALENPTAFFLDIAAFHTLMPVNKKCVEKFGDQWTKPGNIVTNGPFMLKEWKPRDKLVVVKNPNYWDRKNVFLTKINILATEEENTYFNMFEANKTEWIRSVPLQQIPVLRKQKRKDLYLTPAIGVYYYLLNTTRKPLDDPRVRKALNLALDKERICKFVVKAGEMPADSLTPRGMPGYDPPHAPHYNPKAARRLLAEAGYPGGKGFPELSILYNTLEAHRTIAEVIQNMWKQELNINVKLENKEWKVYLKDRQTLNYDIGRAGWFGDYMDPNTFLDLFVTGGGNNHTGWGSKKYDGLIAKAAATLDPKERMEVFKQAERLLVADEMPIIPIYYYVNKNMVKPRVKNFYFNIRDFHTFKGVYIAPH